MLTAVAAALLRRCCLQAGERAGLGHAFALQLLQQADTLGLQASRSACEEVVEACLSARDYPAASIAWLYARLYCAGLPHRHDMTELQALRAAPAAGSAQQPQPQQAQQQEQPAAGGAAWASKSLLRLYLSGMSQWLAQGELSRKQQRQLRSELAQLAAELSARGARVPKQVAAALSAKGDAAAAAPADVAEGGGGAGSAEAVGFAEPTAA